MPNSTATPASSRRSTPTASCRSPSAPTRTCPSPAASGLIGEDWDYDASLTHGRNLFESATKRTLNASLGAASPTRFDTGEYELRQTVGNLDFTRELSLLGTSFALALGGEYRYENYLTRAGDEASYVGTGADGASGLRPSEEVDLDRNVFGTYAELSGDLTDRLFVDAATRWERYDDAGSKLTGKLSGRYRLTDAVALRGAVSNNFRAPSLAQVGFQHTTSNFGTGGTLTDIRVLSVNDPIARALGAEDLDPETSKNFSIGLTAQLSERFDLSFDVFRIDVKDRITLSQRIGSDALEQYVLDNFGVAGVHDVNFFTNAADTRTDGAELVLNYHQPFADGQLGVTTAYTYNHTKVTATRARRRSSPPWASATTRWWAWRSATPSLTPHRVIASSFPPPGATPTGACWAASPARARPPACSTSAPRSRSRPTTPCGSSMPRCNTSSPRSSASPWAATTSPTSTRSAPARRSTTAATCRTTCSRRSAPTARTTTPAPPTASDRAGRPPGRPGCRRRA